MEFNKDVLNINPEQVTQDLVTMLRNTVRKEMRRYGGVLGISGGVDSSVVLALCVRAFGPERVVALMLPEMDSDPESEALARRLAAHYGVEPILENITATLDGFG
ncbi:MAG TPA: NAD(+) synthase, partial [Chloroflexi bacterium]|nr:NAD(+) synthase [Chloroflexota bacterium]